MATPMSVAASSTKSRGLGITKTDMEASRLVFVYVRDAKPRRKVAVPLPDDYTWADFIEQVKSKLKIVGVAQIFLASSGHVVTSLDELQDIDELCVVEGPAAAHANGASTSEIMANGAEPSTPVSRGQAHQYAASSARRAEPEGGSGSSAAGRDDDEQRAKYIKRANPLKRTLQRLFPAWFAPTLPVTTRDIQEDGRTPMGAKKKRRVRSGIMDVRAVVGLVLLLGIMFIVYRQFKLLG